MNCARPQTSLLERFSSSLLAVQGRCPAMRCQQIFLLHFSIAGRGVDQTYPLLGFGSHEDKPSAFHSASARQCDKILVSSGAGVVKLADARDSKSRGVHSPCGFDSHLRHHPRPSSIQTGAMLSQASPFVIAQRSRSEKKSSS